MINIKKYFVTPPSGVGYIFQSHLTDELLEDIKEANKELEAKEGNDSDYKMYTVKELIDKLKEYSEELPLKENSLVTLGDFEGNYLHGYITVCTDTECGKSNIFLGYEMHESIE